MFAQKSAAVGGVTWWSTVFELLQTLLNQSNNTLLKQSNNTMVPKEFCTVGSRQANSVLLSLDLVECLGNNLDPIIVSNSAPTCQAFD